MKEVELNPIEQTSYWWIKTIKSKVRELRIEGTNNKDENKFLEIFNNLTKQEYRNLYLKLTEYITEDVNNYVPIGDVIEFDAFNQDTEKGKHERLNEELSEILGKKVPDIRLASRSYKDSVIYTNIFGSCMWYKSCGTTDLPNRYEKSYLLTGDEEILKFENTLEATLFIISNNDSKFKSIPILKERFCHKYSEKNNIENYHKIIALFKYVFNKGNDGGYILGNHYNDNYWVFPDRMNKVDILPYLNDGEYYAAEVLKEDTKGPYQKKLNG